MNGVLFAGLLRVARRIKRSLITPVRPSGPSFEAAYNNDFSHRQQKILITWVIRTTRRERQEEVPLASFDSFPPVECDLKYSRERERKIEKKLQSQTDRPKKPEEQLTQITIKQNAFLATVLLFFAKRKMCLSVIKNLTWLHFYDTQHTTKIEVVKKVRKLFLWYPAHDKNISTR